MGNARDELVMFRTILQEARVYVEPAIRAIESKQPLAITDDRIIQYVRDRVRLISDDALVVVEALDAWAKGGPSEMALLTHSTLSRLRRCIEHIELDDRLDAEELQPEQSRPAR